MNQDLRSRGVGGSKLARGVVALLSTLAVLALTVLLANPASAAGSITVSKTSGLNPAGETVTVNGSGFTPNANLFVAFCNPAVPNGGACDMSNFKQVATTASGAFSAPVSLKLVAQFGTTDCTKLSCTVQTNNSGNPTNAADVAEVPVTFGVAGAATTAAPAASLPAGTNAGKADTSGQLQLAAIGGGLVVLLLAAGGVMFYRRSDARH
jgi:hypothetical protein